MRPTDENQQSTRPNLMSSGKRGGNEESILAKLERDAGRGRGMRTSRLALYAAGGVLAVGLAGALLWLASDQGSTEVVMAQAPVPVPAEATVAASEPRAATIVDEPQPPANAPPQHDVPPLVLLAPPASQPQPAAIGVAPEPLPASAADKAASAALQPKAKAALAMTAQAEPKRAGKAAKRPDSARARPAGKAAAPTRVASHRAAGRQGARPKKSVAPAQPAATADSDVALISAVIQHATNRANAEETDCGPDAKCAAKTTSEP